MANLDDLQGAYSTSQLRALCENGRGVFNMAGDQLGVIAAELRVNLRGLPGNPMLFGIDARAVARRVTNPLLHASVLQHEAARSMSAAWFAYQELVLNPTKSVTAKFDVDG